MNGPDWFLITTVYLSGFLSGWLVKGLWKSHNRPRRHARE
jgi:hypothetical protein